jgi:hypothetical protein
MVDDSCCHFDGPYCWVTVLAMWLTDVCHDGCADQSGDETAAFIKCLLWVRKKSAETSERIFGLENRSMDLRNMTKV